MIQVLQETTEWNTDYKVPNHMYLLSDRNRFVGYIRAGTKEVIRFEKPHFFDRRRRTFKKIMELDK